jgi:PIN domain nuclease of toxin-antitoxin system
MNVLLDTHTFIWYEGNTSLTEKAREIGSSGFEGINV